jgi:hypothetical protein
VLRKPKPKHEFVISKIKGRDIHFTSASSPARQLSGLGKLSSLSYNRYILDVSWLYDLDEVIQYITGRFNVDPKTLPPEARPLPVPPKVKHDIIYRVVAHSSLHVTLDPAKNLRWLRNLPQVQYVDSYNKGSWHISFSKRYDLHECVDYIKQLIGE